METQVFIPQGEYGLNISRGFNIRLLSKYFNFKQKK